MKISIIASAYNIENYIEKCLESLVNQTYKDIEIIIINDGSTDNTLNSISKYAEYDSRILVVTQDNQGVQMARKKGLSLATGEYFLLIDGDDYLDKDCIEKLVNSIGKDDYDIVYYNYRLIEREEVKPRIAQLNYNNAEENNFLYDYFTVDGMQNGLWLKFIKKQFIYENDINFINTKYSYGEDLLGTIILGSYKPKVFYLKECLYNYVIRPDSATNKLHNIMQLIDIFRELDEKFSESEILKRYKDEYEYFKFRETYMIYCIYEDYEYCTEEKKNKLRRTFYDYWNEQKVDISCNKVYQRKYRYFNTIIKEKLLYYSLDFELGQLISKYILSNKENNNKRLEIINSDLTANNFNRLKIYNSLYEKILGLESNDILKKYLYDNNLKNVILYGNLNLAIALKNKISTYEFISTLYIADGYVSDENIINTQRNREIFINSDKIIVLPIHAYERIKEDLINQKISSQKIISIDKILL